MSLDLDLTDSDTSPTSILACFDPPLTEMSAEKKNKNAQKQKKPGFCSNVGFVCKILLSLLFGTVLQIMDWVTDIETIRRYVEQRSFFFAIMLSFFLFLYVVVAAAIGLWRLRQQPDVYETLWSGGHTVVKAITVFFHCIGLSQVPLSIDLAFCRLAVRFGTDIGDEDERKLKEKTKHYVSMSLVHTFLESAPQLLLQTVFLYMRETYGTKQQCFPSFDALVNAKKEPALTLWHIRSNGSVSLGDEDCQCSYEKNRPTACRWKLDWVFILSAVMSLASLALNVIRHGPIACIEESQRADEEDEEKRKEEEKTKEDETKTEVINSSPSFTLAVEKSRLPLFKIAVYALGILSGIAGCLGFLLIFITWTFMTSRWLFFFIPLIFLQISQPNWLAFMWSRFLRRDLRDAGPVAYHRGVWWRYFLTVTPLAYIVAISPQSVLMAMGEAGEDDVADDLTPVIYFDHRSSKLNSSTSSTINCGFALVNLWDEEKWRNAILGIYPHCEEEPWLKRVKGMPILELGNEIISAPGTIDQVSIRCAAIFFGVSFSLLQMWIFRDKSQFSRRLLIWPIVLGAMGILNNLLIMYNQNFEGSDQTALFVFAGALFFLTQAIVVLTPMFLLCRKCSACCCRLCCR